MKTILVRTGKFRPDEVERSRVQPDAIVSSIAQLPEWLERTLRLRVHVGVDLIEIERIRRALERHGDGFKERCFTEAERAYCDSKPNPPQHYAGRFAAKEAVGKALGSGVYFTWKEIEIRGRPKPGVLPERPHGRVGGEGRRGHDRAVDDPFARARRGGRGRRGATHEAAAAAHRRRDAPRRGGAPGLAGRADGTRRHRRRRARAAPVPGTRHRRLRQGNNGGDGRVCARVLREAGRETTSSTASATSASPT